jgi:hypothetical protein
MKYRPRQGRTLFLAYLCCAYVLVLIAAPLATALERSSMQSASAGASRPGARAITFERLDRNGDGFLGKFESAALPGLSAVFELADGNRDGRLDKVEFARALGMLGTAR